jgi:PAS domain S-box-containing protein
MAEKTPPSDTGSRRQLAEQRLAAAPGGLAPGDGDVRRLHHELQVHQVELEMQNSELQASEEALAASEERMRLAMLATNDVIWDWNVVTDQQTWSGAARAVFGWTDIVDRQQTAAWWLERVHADDRERVLEEFHRALGDAQVRRWEDEYRFLHLDGGYRWVADRATILRDVGGRALRMVGAMQDVTERRQHDDRMRQLSLAVEQSSNGILITDLAGKDRVRQRRVRGFVGLCRRRNCWAAIRVSCNPGRRRARPTRICGARWPRGEVWRGEFVNRRKNGEFYNEAEIISPVRQADGKVTHYIGIKEDVTERRKTEEMRAFLAIHGSTRRILLPRAGAAVGPDDGHVLRLHRPPGRRRPHGARTLAVWCDGPFRGQPQLCAEGHALRRRCRQGIVLLPGQRRRAVPGRCRHCRNCGRKATSAPPSVTTPARPSA